MVKLFGREYRRKSVATRVGEDRKQILRARKKKILEHFNEDIKPFGAYKLKQSGVFTVPTMSDELLTKGYQCDWPPYIGKIGS